ncbi:MAG TPA: hypothetical protein VN679_06820 [Candidatus Acidoferrales bacterium]|jgi:hypothetical protein|nr:hypothetical protein [Candidatus Acidoferrales bacterium]
MSPQTFNAIVVIFVSLFATMTGIYIFTPSRELDSGVDKTRLAYLYERKEVVYDNLRDLNFEFKSGKFTQADYDGMRASIENEAARILDEIERLESVNV